MKPFLKWAGNKYQIIDKVKDAIGEECSTLIEPFVGSCSVFLNTNFKNYILCDINADLINLYTTLQEEKDNFVYYSKEFFLKNSSDEYYELRSKFNSSLSTREKSALFIYLNRHCFNGLCRYNKSGGFNVPYGKYKNPYFPEKELLFFIEKASNKNVEFKCQSFEETMKIKKKNSIFYIDSPYVPLNQISNFTSYSSDRFGNKEHELLVSLIEKQKNKVVASNHDTDYSRKLYKSADKIIELEVNRFISANGNRDKAKELIAIYGEDNVTRK